MKRLLPLFAVVLVAGLLWLAVTWQLAPYTLPPDSDGARMLQLAQQRVTAYHSGQPQTKSVLRLVYFYPKDRQPLPRYAERLERIFADVNDFYSKGMKRFGLSFSGLPLERNNGKLLLHMVKGKRPADDYRYESGSQTAAEIREALLPQFDIQREHVLVIYALYERAQDGRYVFHSPYYGGGSQSSGLCHAADCELLDPLLLRSTQRMVFSEHYYPRREVSIGGFNSMYLGGIAHELGHALGLFHDAGSIGEQSYGTALMGGGNITYRNELRGDAAPSFLSRVSALHLLSHPLITQSSKGRWLQEKSSIQPLEFHTEEGQLRIRGVAHGALPAYAAVAYVWRNKADGTDHDSVTYPALLKEDGSFEIQLASLTPQMSFMRLVLLHTNGAAHWWDYHLGFDAKGQPRVPQEFRWPWIVAKMERAVLKADTSLTQTLSKDFVSAAQPEDQPYLRALQQAVMPQPAQDLAAVQTATTWLSDMQWLSAKVGWGKPVRNHYYYDQSIQDGIFLVMRGHLYEKGLYAHAPAQHVYDLQGRWRSFTATCGLRDGAPAGRSAVFRVLGDGRELYRSDALYSGQVSEVSVNVAGVQKLELITQAREGGNHHGSWSIWALPQLRR